jgi:diacylglycerol kinase (ATP)
MKPANFSLRARAKSFQYAWQGILTFLQREHNAWLHLTATVAVIILACITGITKSESLVLVFTIGFVWVAEMFNTCIERMMDFITTEKHPSVKFIKDLAAGAVLVSALTALLIGAIIFIPKFL